MLYDAIYQMECPEMEKKIEPTTEVDSLIVGDLFSKNSLTFKTIDSVFPFIIQIGIVTELNKT